MFSHIRLRLLSKIHFEAKEIITVSRGLRLMWKLCSIVNYSERAWEADTVRVHISKSRYDI